VIIIKGEGNPQAKMFFIGEAPAMIEEALGHPFVGPSGNELMSWLWSHGIQRPQVYIDNIVQYRLPRDDFGVMYVDKKMTIPTPELLECVERIKEKIDEIKPNVVIALGNHVTNCLLGKSGISDWRGSILPLETKGGVYKCVPTYHPSGILHAWKLRPLAIADVGKAQRESWHPFIRLPKRDLLISPNSVREVEEYCRNCEDVGKVSVDIECQYNASRITCIGISCNKSHGMTIPFIGPEGSWWGSEIGKIKDLLKKLLYDSGTKIVGHNFQYDWCVLDRLGFPVGNLWFDTKIAHHCLYPELPNTLETLASLYTDEMFWKWMVKDWDHVEDWDTYWKYNCLDACVTFEVMEQELPLIDEVGVRVPFMREMALVPTLVGLTSKGIRIDLELRKSMMANINKRIKVGEQRLDDLLPDGWLCHKCGGAGEIGKKKVKKCPECHGKKIHINADSPKQISELVYDWMKLPSTLRKKSRAVDEEVLIKLQSKAPNPVFQQIIDVRGLGHAHTFAAMALDTDHRMRTILSTNTETGRMNSTKSPWGTGGNLQTIPRTGSAVGKICKTIPFRRMYISDPGKILLIPDYEQAEARVMAYESGDPTYMEMFDSGKDVHTENAKWLFDVDVPTDNQRQMGKRISHGINYCMGNDTLRDYILLEMGPEYAISRAEAEIFRGRYFKMYPGLIDLHEWVKNEINTKGYLINSFGRKRVFFGRRNDGTYREAIANIGQSTIADLAHEAMLNLATIKGLEILMQSHDSFILQCVCGEVDGMVGAVVAAMEIPITSVRFDSITYTVPVDMKVGMNWEDAKKYKKERLYEIDIDPDDDIDKQSLFKGEE
jgi:uracil-DNA glycosylase family 4